MEWNKVAAARRMQDYIESHLDQPITLSDLARAARYSPYHAARIFKECTGKSPFEYIRSRRLCLAVDRLGQGRVRVVDVALEFLFDSQDGFTRAFAKEFGLTPKAFQKRRPDLHGFLPTPLRDFFADRQKGIPMSSTTPLSTVFVQVIDHPARTMIVKRGRAAKDYFQYCEEVGCDVWETLGRIEGALREPMGLWLPERFRAPGTSLYAQGVEMPAGYAGPVPDGFDTLALPACKMMVFQGPPFADKDFQTAITSLWDCMNSYTPEQYGYTYADDDGPRYQLAPLGYRGYIEGRPVRALSPS